MGGWKVALGYGERPMQLLQLTFRNASWGWGLLCSSQIVRNLGGCTTQPVCACLPRRLCWCDMYACAGALTVLQPCAHSC